MASYLIHGTAANDTLRVLAADTTAIVADARARHDTSFTATAALGRSLTAAALLAQVFSKRDQDRVMVRIQGDGPVGWIVTEGSKDGGVRGYARYPEAELPPRTSDGKLDVAGLVGREGELAVTRLLETGDPYTGSVELVSGEIAEDVATYLARSEQIASAVLLGVHVDASGAVTHAGGVLVQAMPGATNATLDQLEANVRALGQLTTAMRQSGLLGALDQLCTGLDLRTSSTTLPLEFRCRCSRSRAARALLFFNPSERQDMIAEGGQEAVCHWCGTKYQIDPQEIQALENNPEWLDEA